MRTFLGGITARLQRRYRSKSRNSRARSLMFERLGARRLLAGDAAASVLPSEGEVAPVDIVQNAAVQASATESPLWSDQDGSPLVVQSNGYGYGDVPPAIYEFMGVPGSNGLWTFTGVVVDDESVTGLTVTFGGLLEGYSTTVQNDGSFERLATIPSGTSGFVTVTVTDRDGLTSETAYWYVG